MKMAATEVMIVTQAEAAAVLQMSDKTLRKYMMAAGARIPRPGGRVLCDLDRLGAMLAEAEPEQYGSIDLEARLRAIRDRQEPPVGGNRREGPEQAEGPETQEPPRQEFIEVEAQEAAGAIEGANQIKAWQGEWMERLEKTYADHEAKCETLRAAGTRRVVRVGIAAAVVAVVLAVGGGITTVAWRVTETKRQVAQDQAMTIAGELASAEDDRRQAGETIAAQEAQIAGMTAELEVVGELAASRLKLVISQDGQLGQLRTKIKMLDDANDALVKAERLRDDPNIIGNDSHGRLSRKGPSADTVRADSEAGNPEQGGS